MGHLKARRARQSKAFEPEPGLARGPHEPGLGSCHISTRLLHDQVAQIHFFASLQSQECDIISLTWHLL